MAAFDAEVIRDYFVDHANALVPASLAAAFGSDPTAFPETGIAAYVTLTRLRPGPGGMRHTSAVVTVQVLFLRNMLAGTSPVDAGYPDAIDPLVVNAMSAYLGRILGDLRPTDDLRIDPRGAMGADPFDAPSGYVRVGDRWCRSSTLTFGAVWLNAWAEVNA